MVRRSGIANDIILRGQKKDNINILIDDAKIYGACPNRMDPPTSHILTNNISDIEIIEGPYDVQNFGTLSGAVKISTREPEAGFHGEVNLNVGSYGYRKAGATLSGGNDKIKVLVSTSKETSKQYQDGDGNNFAEQIIKFAPGMTGVHYKPQFADLDAYDKTTFMGKLYIALNENQDLKLGYTLNRSDDVLYPSSKMDALYDDSDIFTLDYAIRNIGRYSKTLDLQYYNSSVEHPMSTFYRNSSGPNSVNEMISKLDTVMRGFKIKNAFDLDAATEMVLGLDLSRRNWDGTYIGKGMMVGATGRKSINDADTDNRALFAEINKNFGDFSLKAGARYDDTSIEPSGSSGLQANDYNALGAFAFGTYRVNGTTSYFGGIGSASRVPDARELYFKNSGGILIGTPTLDQTRNVEIDFGIENSFQNLTLKTKLFHSWLEDYIYFNADRAVAGNAFENIDATIYGIEVSGSYFMTDTLYLDFGVAAQRGRKDQPLAGQSNKNLAEIPPLKANLALNYDYTVNSSARVELIAAKSWDEFDGDNGEQKIDGYAVVNLKLDHAVTDHIGITAGVDNLFDRTYAVSNTYRDLTLLTAGSDIMLMNEPGRYFYLNASYSF